MNSKLQDFNAQSESIKLTMLYLPKLTIPLILITLIHSTHSQSCESTYTFTDSDLYCDFYYGYSDSNCTQYNFVSCTWAECQDQLSSSSTDICVSYQTLTSTDWNTCTNMCCDSSVQYPETYDSINQCQNYLTSFTDLANIIGWSVFGGLLFIFGMITLICLLCKYGCPCGSRCQCECERFEECRESFKEMFNRICCECVLVKKNQQPEHAKQEDASKDLEMTINPDTNTPTGNDRIYI